MRIKWIFFIANSVSVLIMFTFLFVSYVYMVLPNNIILWLSIITIFSALLSSVINYLFMRPIESSIHSLSEQSQEIAKGHFETLLPVEGPLEIQHLTHHFNDMNIQLNEAFNQIKRSEASRKELVANISHDLRTPMASIKAFVSAIQDGVVEDEKEFQSYLHTIGLETERLDQMIQQLFQVSLLDSGVIELQRTRVHVDELLVNVLQHEKIHLERKDIQVQIHLPNPTPIIFVDRTYFQQVLYNLIDNAIRFSEEGGLIDITVDDDESGEHGGCQFVIRDEGEGISEKDLPYIFDRTYRAEKSRNQQFGGSGLGLSIAKTIVEQHKGTIEVSSQPGLGSTFIIRMPQC